LQPRARLKNNLIGPASRYADALALIAGAMLVLGFAPFSLFPLAILAPALLFVLWREATPYRAAWRGFLFGLGMFGAGISWVYVSMHNFGNMPAPMAAVAALLLAALLALYPALLGWLQARWFDRQPWPHGVLVLPALWTLFEWVRGWFLTGFPWLNLGYSQIGTPLAGFAPWLGVYGVSFAGVLSAGLLVQGLQQREKLWVRYVPPRASAPTAKGVGARADIVLVHRSQVRREVSDTGAAPLGTNRGDRNRLVAQSGLATFGILGE
jgi:apolipoprotein N-acyltransferase